MLRGMADCCEPRAVLCQFYVAVLYVQDLHSVVLWDLDSASYHLWVF